MNVSRRSFLTLLVSAPAIVRGSDELELEELEPLADVQRPFTRETLREAANVPMVRRYMLPFGPDEGFDQLVEPGRFGRFVARPQMIFRPDRLMLALYECWDVFGVSAEGEPQLDQVVDGHVFAPTSYGGRMGFRTVHVGADLVVCARNKSSEAQRFGAVLVGSAVA